MNKGLTRYKVVGRCLGRSFTFNVMSHGRQEASKDATEHLREMYPGLTFEVKKCTRTKIDISGMDVEGDDILMAVVNPYPESGD